MSTDAAASAPARHPVLGVVALVAAATLWSLNGVLIKQLNAADVPAITIACLRSLIGGVVFMPLAWRARYTLRRVAPHWPIASVIAFTLMTSTFVIATTITTAANAIILQYTSAIWVFLLSPLLIGERTRPSEGLILMVAMAGVGTIFFGHSSDAAGSMRGLWVALISGLGYGTLTVLLRGLRRVDPFVVSALNALGSGALLVLPTLLWGTFHLSPRMWGAVTFMALVQFVGPYLLFSWALRHVPAMRAGLIVLLEVILNPLWTYLGAGETPHISTLIGGLLILAGVAGAIFLHRRPAPKPAEAGS
jgi:drug/metabolite transporter (DMT)-like permease